MKNRATYSLSLESDGKEVHLRNSSVDIICINPCLIREDHNIFFVSDIEGSKLRPFLSKENILIPKKTELKYFGGFVLNAINNFKVEYSGFEIIEVIPEKEAVLVLEIGLKGTPVLILTYNYKGNKIHASESSISFTYLKTKGIILFSENISAILYGKRNAVKHWGNLASFRMMI